MTDPVDSTLGQLRLDGALFFRGELSEPFEFESSPLTLADALVPGADRLTLFHIVASGSCWIAVDDGVRYWAEAGDVIVMPYADHYVMGGAGTAERVSILALLDPLPWSTMPMLRHGGGGRRTDVVCGYLHSLDPLFDPAMRALPPVFVVHLTDGPAARWVRASIDYALADAAVPTNLSPSPLATRLPELVAQRGPAHPPRHRTGDRPRLDRRPARPAPRSGAGSAARRSGRTVDGCRAGRPPSVRPGRRSTTASGRCSGSRRSATSRPGGCTWRRTSSPRRSCRCSRSPAGSATTPRRRSAGRSSASAASRRATGVRRRDVNDAHHAGVAPPSGHSPSHRAIWVAHVLDLSPRTTLCRRPDRPRRRLV